MRNSKRISVLAGGTAALIGVGVAFAAWTSTGTGSGTATADSMGLGNLSASGAAVTGLFPTGSQDSVVTVTNNNPYPVSLDSITVTGITADAASATAGCTVAAHGVTATLKGDWAAANKYIAAKPAAGTAPTVANTFVIHMDGASADECKGATFTVNYSVSGHSVNATS